MTDNRQNIPKPPAPDQPMPEDPLPPDPWIRRADSAYS